MIPLAAAAGAAVASEATNAIGDFLGGAFQSVSSRQKESCDDSREHLARALSGQLVGVRGDGSTGNLIEFMVDRAKNGPDAVRRNCWATAAREYFTRSGQVPPPAWAQVIGWTGSTTTQVASGVPRQDSSPLTPMMPLATPGYPMAGKIPGEMTAPPASAATTGPGAAGAAAGNAGAWMWVVGGAIAIVAAVLIARAAAK